MTDRTEEEVKALLDQAYAAGRIAGQTEGAPDRYEFSNGRTGSGRGDEADYQAELSAKVFELRGKGVRRVADHADVLEIKTRFGRD